MAISHLLPPSPAVMSASSHEGGCSLVLPSPARLSWDSILPWQLMGRAAPPKTCPAPKCPLTQSLHQDPAHVFGIKALAHTPFICLYRKMRSRNDALGNTWRQE